MDDNDKSLKQAVKDGDYLVVDLTTKQIRSYFDGKQEEIEELDNLLDECQGNIFSGSAKEQFIVVRIR